MTTTPLCLKPFVLITYCFGMCCTSMYTSVAIKNLIPWVSHCSSNLLILTIERQIKLDQSNIALILPGIKTLDIRVCPRLSTWICYTAGNFCKIAPPTFNWTKASQYLQENVLSAVINKVIKHRPTNIIYLLKFSY